MIPPHRIGLFGGSFDPIHLGHLEIARRAVQACHLDELRFIPCRVSPHKLDSPPTPAALRLRMLELAVADYSWAHIDESELHAPPPSFSYQTAASIHAVEPESELFWLMGADQWEALPRWKHPEKLASLVRFIVFRRNSLPLPRREWRMEAIDSDHPASSSEIRRSQAFGQLREEWLHPKVSAFIREHQLYRGS